MAKVMVEYVWDHEVEAWGFALPALHRGRREDARRRAREAIAAARETADTEPGEAEYLDVQVG